MIRATLENRLPSHADGNLGAYGRTVGFASANAGGAEPAYDSALRFRRFTVMPNARQLLADGVPINLGSRAFDLLHVLLKARGQIVSKADIFRHVWPSTTVDESNLRFQMTSLRAILGHDRDVIKTIPGRGYLLIADALLDSTPIHAPLHYPDGVAPNEMTSTPTASDFAAHHTVAIIDDDHGVREAIEGLLMSAGLATRSFGSVQAFRDHEWCEPPICLILDVWLPGTSGIDFNDAMIAEGDHPPVIFISGHADVHTSVRAMKAGAVEFLTKPVRHQELLDAIQSVLSR